MLKTRTIKVKSIKNEEIIMAKTIIKIIITRVIMTIIKIIMMVVRMEIGSRMKL